ncbi:ester cyclase [bacterium]|nr:ester cyclase [bacterium]
MRRVRIVHVLIVMALLAMTACTQPDNTGAQNAATLERVVAEVWNSGDFAMLADAIAENFVRHNPVTWDPPMIEGRQAFQDYVTKVRKDFTNFNVMVHNRFGQGNLVAANWTVTGTHAESGKDIKVDGITLSRFAEGKLVEEWVAWDTQSIAQQIGMTPETSMK